MLRLTENTINTRDNLSSKLRPKHDLEIILEQSSYLILLISDELKCVVTSRDCKREKIINLSLTMSYTHLSIAPKGICITLLFLGNVSFKGWIRL